MALLGVVVSIVWQDKGSVSVSCCVNLACKTDSLRVCVCVCGGGEGGGGGVQSS